MSLKKEELRSWVEEAVKASTSSFECPDCHAVFGKSTQYMDHRIGEKFAEAVKAAKAEAPKPEEFLDTCKDGICAIVDERLEAKLSAQEGEEEGLYSQKDDPE